MKLKSLSLIIITFLSMPETEAASGFQELVNGLFSPNSSTPNVLVTAHMAPYLSKVLKSNDNICTAPLEQADFKQMQYDQSFIKSLLDLYKIPDYDRESLFGPNLYMSILLQRVRNTTEAIMEIERNSSNINFMNDLSQSDFAMASIVSNVDTIRNTDALIRAHESMEISNYNIDGYIKLASDEFKKCSEKKSACMGSDQLWSKWFESQGFGIASPALNTDMLSAGSETTKDNFEVLLPPSSPLSKEFVKNIFEMINIYGGANFDYLAYLKGEELKADQGISNGQVYAPGKVVAGILLKLTNQRLVAFYKYQKCRSLNQNNANLRAYNAVKSKKSVPSKSQVKNRLIECKSGRCPAGSIQITTETLKSKAVAIIDSTHKSN